MADNLRFWFVYLAMVTAVVFIGWNQPIRYRFMSPKEIELEEHPIVDPTPVVRDNVVTRDVLMQSPTPNWMWDPSRKTLLDRAPYNQNYGTSVYRQGLSTPRTY